MGEDADRMLPRRRLLAVAALLAVACSPGDAAHGESDTAGGPRPAEPVVGLPCEGCEAVFDGLPAALPAEARIAPPDEPGEPMRLEGTVFDPEGRPAAGVIVYAYHTDARGVYPGDDRLRGRPGHRHGRLRGWARSDGRGQYAFATIRPAGYPGTDLPAHVHLHVLEVGRCTYWIDDVVFDDDPRLTPAQRRLHGRGRGGPGVISPRRDDDGTWVARRDIVLGKGIDGYPPRAPAP